MDKLPTVRQLQYFAALAETGHYRKAAERIGISQPSLSLQISNLESVLQIKLVERGRAGAVLTPAGRDVLARSRRILSEITSLAETSNHMKDGLAGTIRLGASPTLGPYLLPKVLRKLHEEHPQLRLLIRDGAAKDLVEDLLFGRHDLILTQLPVHSTDVTTLRLFREPLRLVVARDHRLARVSDLIEPSLRGESILALSDRYFLHAQVADIARDLGAHLRQDYEGTSLDALRQMVAMDMGVTFLPALYANSEIPQQEADVAIVPFRQGRLTRSIGLVWRKTSGKSLGYGAIADVISDVTRQHFAGLVQVER